MPRHVKVLIADDHPIFRAGLRQVIERDSGITVVAEADDGRAALDALPRCGADVAILDVDMPVMDGFQVAQAIREKRLAVEVIILTMHKDERFLNAALDLGVKGYLIKDSAAADVINCIKAVADGREFVTPQLTGLAAQTRPECGRRARTATGPREPLARRTARPAAGRRVQDQQGDRRHPLSERPHDRVPSRPDLRKARVEGGARPHQVRRRAPLPPVGSGSNPGRDPVPLPATIRRSTDRNPVEAWIPPAAANPHNPLRAGHTRFPAPNC